MKHTPFFYRLPHLAILVLLLSCIGCAPIRTNVRSSHPPRLEGSTVLVYELTDSLPAAAEVLGDLRIKDFEPWIGYRYDELIEVLGKETNRHGGNAIRLTSYKEPSYYGSAGNRIAADMCLLEDSVYTASYFINLATQQAYAKLRNEADRKHLSGKTSFNRNALYVNAGYVFPQETERGWEIGIGYQRIWNVSDYTQPFLGPRYVRYFGLFTDSGRDYTIRTQYFGLDFGGSYTINDRFVIPLIIGLGYLHHRNNNVSLGGYDIYVETGFEYRISYRVGIGINCILYALTGKYNEVTDSSYGNSVLNGSLRFYF